MMTGVDRRSLHPFGRWWRPAGVPVDSVPKRCHSLLPLPWVPFGRRRGVEGSQQVWIPLWTDPP